MSSPAETGNQRRPQNDGTPKVSWGGWCHIPSGLGAETMAAAGFDWVCIDGQHGQIGAAAMFDMVRAVDAAGAVPVVRVAGAVPEEIGRALDAGAYAIVVPNVRTVADAQMAAGATMLQPAGSRSFAATRAKLYPTKLADLTSDRPRCHLMIETKTALDEVETLAALPGVAGLFVGPEDLRLALEIETAELGPHLAHVAEVCAAHGVQAGAFCGSIPVGAWLNWGYSFLALGSDSALLFAAAKSARAAVAWIR